MHAAFRQGGREAIDKVMRTQPAAFLKLLVLLVPREMKVESQRRSLRQMSDEQLEAGHRGHPGDAGCSARRAPGAKVIEAMPEPVALPAPAPKTTRKVRKSDQLMNTFG